MIRSLSATAVLFAALALAGPATAQPIDASRGSLQFGYKQEGVPGEGVFKRFGGDIEFDAAHLKDAHVRIEVDLTSVDVHDATTNNELQGAEWFQTKVHPKAVFAATGAKASGDHYEATGLLTIKGITRPVTARFTARQDAARATLLEGQVQLMRSQFKVGEGAWADTAVLADEVSIRFRLTLPRK